MGTCSSKTFLISVFMSKFRNCTIQVSVLSRLPVVYEIFGWKCDKEWTRSLESVLSPGALFRKCFKGNHKKSFQGGEIAYLHVRCLQFSVCLGMFMSINIEMLGLKRSLEVCSGNLDDCLCSVTITIRLCYLARSVIQIILWGVYFSKNCLIKETKMPFFMVIDSPH